MALYPLADPAISYTEGYVLPATPVPVLHAWITVDDAVVDTTLRPEEGNDDKRVLGEIPEGWEYYGVKLPLSACMHVYLNHKAHISLIDDYQCRWPLIRKSTLTNRVLNTPSCKQPTHRGNICGKRC